MRRSLLTLWVGTVLSCGLLLQASEPDVPRTVGAAAARAGLLRTVVTQSLRVADQEDPLQRAASCNDIAADLARAIAQATARGDTDEAVRLGRYLNKVLGRGVAPNVEQLDPADLAGGRQLEWQAVGKQLDDLITAIEKDLKGPVPPSAPLRRVLDDSRRDLEDIWDFAKGKGKAKKGKGKKGKGKGKAKKKGKGKYDDDWDWPEGRGKKKKGGKKAGALPAWGEGAFFASAPADGPRRGRSSILRPAEIATMHCRRSLYVDEGGAGAYPARG